MSLIKLERKVFSKMTQNGLKIFWNDGIGGTECRP